MNKSIDFYPILRMKRLGDIVLLQPWWKGKSVDRCLSCDLASGTLQLVDHEDITSSYREVFGVIGMTKAKSTSCLVVVTDAREVAVLRGFPVFLITKTSVLYASSGVSKSDRHIVQSLKSAVDPMKYGDSMFMSAGGDLTLSSQKHSNANDSESAWQRADPWLTWNRALAIPIIEAGGEKFTPAILKGFISQLTNISFSRGQNGALVNVTIIARRSARRPGTRQWRRGADAEANVANFVESEQLVEFQDGTATSFVQVRGSIPIMWSQTPNLKYKIPISIGPSGRSEAVLKSHILTLSRNYGSVTAINLANLTGREGKLSSAYASAAEAVGKEIQDFHFVPFDFHKECGATNYKNLSKLWDKIQSDHQSFGCWSRGEQGKIETQNGVFRTNCIDTLDRTNVVQGLLARKSLEHILQMKGLLDAGETFDSHYPEFERQFRIIWADHGDEISRQYAGTGAMKSAFTRTGKRDLAGLLDDGAKSMTRYFLNNFRDGGKQDALDLVTGTFKPERDAPAYISVKMSPFMPLVVAMSLVVVAYKNFSHLQSLSDIATLESMKSIWLLAILSYVIVQAVKKNGKYLVDSPIFRPDLSVPWDTKQ